MPAFTYTPRTVNDKSSLAPGYHPAFLLAIVDEEVPDGWQMKEKSPRMWRWQFAVFHAPEQIAQGGTPEHQSATSSQTFSPGGKFQPSKAYTWTCKLLGRKVEAGETIDLDPLLPLPCMVMVTRTKSDGTPIEYANLVALEPWPDGTALLMPTLRAQLAAFLETPVAASAQPVAPSPQPYAPQAAPTTWAQPAPTQPALPGTAPGQVRW
jgi:hypothetical protein